MKRSILWAITIIGCTADPWVGSEGLAPVFPSADPFYTYNQENLEKYPPGSVLRWREIGTANYSSVERGIQLVYRTSDHAGRAQKTVSTILIPQSSSKNQLVVYNTPEDASNINCSPSYGALTQSAETGVQKLLNKGYMVSIPDYEGPYSAFSAGVSSGRRTLDSIRAVIDARRLLNLRSIPAAAIWGYSGGSIAAGHAAEQKGLYAPELNVVATAVGGFITNLTATFYQVNGGPYAGFIPSAILGLASEYNSNSTNLSMIVNESLKPDSMSRFNLASEYCSIQNQKLYRNQNILNYFADGSGILDYPEVREVLDNNTLGRKSLNNIPLFIYQGTKDKIALISEVESTVKSYCSLGNHILYNRVQGSSHISTQLTHADNAIDFISASFRGLNVATSCRSGAVQSGLSGDQGGSDSDLVSSGSILRSSNYLLFISVLSILLS